ncbi:monovalent cation/H(+) antiporter subunit G [Bordetella petrii]|uniref:PH adaptation potassium efflux protein n=1 Tax=Bordetella petrii (strain ATCC BAA-461 / DSM 12804 / CCUG 43448 / CIP 107267 / Se-1111R) TaxID=340100 RepID=A9IP69_BORPD|nr:monovalent cation/H(+) antiporter subunit G [Bordetella petrii]CAP42911.1 putative pH adaptation potassium efflux protein [Bordetella petrii]
MSADIPLWAGIPASILLVAGGLLALVGSAGLLRFNNFFCRIHAPTLGNTLGAGCVLVASMLVFSAVQQRPVVHEVLITLLLFITSPVTAMLLIRAAVYRGRRQRGESYPTATSPRTRYGRTDL